MWGLHSAGLSSHLSLDSQSYFLQCCRHVEVPHQVGLLLYQNACRIFFVLFCFCFAFTCYNMEFLSVDVIDIWGPDAPFHARCLWPSFGDCSTCCRMFRSTPGFYLLRCQYNASSTQPLSCDNEQCLQTYQMFAWWGSGGMG